MIPGFAEFEFDLPEALLNRLVEVFSKLDGAPLVEAIVKGIPDAQGVYQLFLDGKISYIGKTDAEAGLRQRLMRHAAKIQHRIGLNPERVSFRAVRVFVFTAVDLEAQLIKHYDTDTWNGSGFGSNDPGRERDTTTYKLDTNLSPSTRFFLSTSIVPCQGSRYRRGRPPRKFSASCGGNFPTLSERKLSEANLGSHMWIWIRWFR